MRYFIAELVRFRLLLNGKIIYKILMNVKKANTQKAKILFK